MIIGFGGYAGAGKDAAASFLVNDHNYVRRAIADPLKAFCFDEHSQHIQNLLVTEGEDYVKLHHDLEYRAPLLKWGDLLKQHFSNPLLDQYRRDIASMQSQGQFDVVTPDIRGKGEADLLHELGGITALIVRPGVGRRVQHATEDFAGDESNFDLVIYNDGGLAELAAQVAYVVANYRAMNMPRSLWS